MRLDLDDGYTLAGETSPVFPVDADEPLYTGLPVVRVTYRPALPEAIAEYRFKNRRATDGKGEIRAVAEFVAGHLVTWDVTNKGEPVPADAANVARVPDPILTQLFDLVSRWAPKAVADKGNS